MADLKNITLVNDHIGSVSGSNLPLIYPFLRGNCTTSTQMQKYHSVCHTCVSSQLTTDTHIALTSFQVVNRADVI